MSATAGLKPLSTRLKRASAGLNLCHDNASALFKQRPELECLQIHPEHLIQEAGGTYREQLDELRLTYVNHRGRRKARLVAPQVGVLCLVSMAVCPHLCAILSHLDNTLVVGWCSITL